MTLNSEESLQRQLEGWLTEYGGSDVCVAELLCNRHAKEPGRKALHYEDAAGYKLNFRSLISGIFPLGSPGYFITLEFPKGTASRSFFPGLPN